MWLCRPLVLLANVLGLVASFSHAIVRPTSAWHPKAGSSSLRVSPANGTVVFPISTLSSSVRDEELSNLLIGVAQSNIQACSVSSSEPAFALDFISESSSSTEDAEGMSINELDALASTESSLVEITASGKVDKDDDLFVAINKHTDALTKAATDQLRQVLRLIGGNLPRKDSAGHLPCDVATLGLSPDQLRRIDEILADPVLKSKDLQKKARAVQSEITPHLVYRYLVASGWAKNYNGKPFAEAIADTINWRRSSGITSFPKEEGVIRLARQGVAYYGGLDKEGRAILYIKLGRGYTTSGKDHSNYQKLLLHAVERVNHESVAKGSGQFLTVLDLRNFSRNRSPPKAAIKEVFASLKWHYPHRLGGIYVVHGGPAFRIIWNLLKPLIPRRVLSRTLVVPKSDFAKKFGDQVGLEFIEESYGGTVIEPDHHDVRHVFAHHGFRHRPQPAASGASASSVKSAGGQPVAILARDPKNGSGETSAAKSSPPAKPDPKASKTAAPTTKPSALKTDASTKDNNTDKNKKNTKNTVAEDTATATATAAERSVKKKGGPIFRVLKRNPARIIRDYVDDIDKDNHIVD